METTYSPSVWYARIVGIVLTLVGILGLVLTASQDNVESLLGFDVNLTHNLVHLLTGIVGIAIGYSAIKATRTFALVFGLVYTVLGVWGLAVGGDFDPLGLFGRINMADHVLHIALGVVGLAAWAMSRDEVGERAA
jgi:Domain of unknown function (DUF4383)